MDTILLPTDFSIYSERALEFAIEIAKKSDAKIIVDNAFYIPTMDVNMPPTIMEEMYKEEREGSEKKVKEICEIISSHKSNTGKYLVSDYTVEQNIPASEIAHTYKRIKPDLIILGTEGKDHFLGLIRSTTFDVLQKVECPVLIIKKDSGVKEFRKIYFALEDIKEDIIHVNQIFSIATLYNSEITIVHVEKGNKTEDKIRLFEERMEEAKSFVDSAKEKLNYPNIKLKFIFNDEITEGLNHFLLEEKADLIVLEKQKRLWIENLFHKSMTKNLIKENNIPILIIHKR